MFKEETFVSIFIAMFKTIGLIVLVFGVLSSEATKDDFDFVYKHG